MRLKVGLKVEVGELIGVSELEKFLKLGVGKNAATILGILKRVLTNVTVNLTSYLSTCHLSAFRFSEELGKLNTDLSGLHETARSTVSSL